MDTAEREIQPMQCDVKIVKTTLASSPDNYAHFISSDGILTSPICKTLKAIGLLDETKLLSEELISNRIKIEPMLITDTPARPFDKVALDTVGPLPPTPSGNRHVLTMQCQLSKFCMAVPLPDIRAVTVTDTLSRYFLPIFGAPRAILTDRRTSFINL